jgi:iron complex outermembrane receptor protein
MHKGKLGQPKATALSIAVKSALCLSLAPGLVAAQDSVSDEIMETVTVTGSRIPRLDPQMVTPVQVYDQQYIENTGAATIQEFLFTSSMAGPALFNENQTLSQTAGTSNFDSRGFGADYVVILLNGRRLPGDPLLGRNRSNLNLVPLAAVARVEYLSTGASAIYGADAVQGVINIITKQEFEGLEARLNYQNDMDDGGSRAGFSLTGGVVSDKGFATMSFEYLEQKAVAGAGLYLFGSALAPDGTDGTSSIGAAVTDVTYIDFGADFTTYPAAQCQQERLVPTTWTPPNGQDCNYDYAPLYQVIPAMERMNFLANGEYAIGERGTGYAEFRMSRNVTEVRNGAAPAIFNMTGAASLADVDAELGSNMANSSSVYIARRATDAGPRATDNTNTAYSVTLGSRFEIGDSGELDINVQRVESEMNRVGVGGQLSRSGVEAAVQAGTFDPTQLYDPQWFIDQGLAVSTQRQAVGEDMRFNLTFTGEAGNTGLGYAVGAQYRDETFVDRSDALSSQGDISGGAGSNGAGERDVMAFFGELSWSPIDSIELSGALRYDDYEWSGRDQSIQENVSSGDDATTYMVGASWRPTDRLMLRASYGTGFKAPTLGELYLGGSFGVNRAVDTRHCDATTASGAPQAEIDLACSAAEIRSVSGGNPNLVTEESTSLSVGMVWEPTDNWSMALDFYEIEVDGKIGSLSTQEILNNEDQYPDLVNRVNGRLTSPNAFVASNSQNLNIETGSGVDYSTQVNWEMGSGSIVADVRLAYLLSHERQTSAVQPLCEDAGTTSEPDWRANGQVGWQADRWTAMMTFRYIGETTDLVGGRTDGTCDVVTSSVGETGVDSYLEFGLRGTFNIGESTELSAGVINLTDEKPPFSLEAAGEWPWFDQSLYDTRGTRFYLGLKHSFY